jgi:hypothetical protein
MHSYFFVQGRYEGMGFDFSERDVPGLLASAGADTAARSCEDRFPDQVRVANAVFQSGESRGAVLFGWDGCPCTAIAQSRFAEASLCLEQLTWQNPSSDLMSYLQCREGDPSHHSFVYIRDTEGHWRFRGTGFAFEGRAMTDSTFTTLVQDGNVASGCQSEFVVNIYGEQLSECRAAATDASGSWMWDGKCTERGGGVHQICMSELPADFAVTTGQPPWSERRVNQRHCVCIGAWSLYMTREADPEWTTTESWPFCDAVPMSALTTQYLGRWREWNGIPAAISVGATRLVEKCLLHRSGPGSAGPSHDGACTLLSAFRGLREAEGGALREVNLSRLESGMGLNCTGITHGHLVAASAGNGGGSGGGSLHEAAEEGPAQDVSLASYSVKLSLFTWLIVLGMSL